MIFKIFWAYSSRFAHEIGYSNEVDIVLDPVNLGEGEYHMAPLFNENTVSFAFNKKISFLVLKQINNIYYDRDYYVARLITAIEHWLIDWLSFRAGIEGTIVHMEGEQQLGIGATGGFTFRVPAWGLDIDANISIRDRPSRIVPGGALSEMIIFFSISKVKVSISR